jgi:hypothetical protein
MQRSGHSPTAESPCKAIDVAHLRMRMSCRATKTRRAYASDQGLSDVIPDGKPGGRWRHGEPIMLLTYTGKPVCRSTPCGA